MRDIPAIEVLELRKSFGENHAVKGVSFEVRQGEIFSLLGPNGAGKTTTISMLSCLLRPNDGDARVMGHSIRSDSMGVKSVLGVVPQDIALYEDLTARENLGDLHIAIAVDVYTRALALDPNNAALKARLQTATEAAGRLRSAR